jgi:hypothetical protein
MEVRALSMPRPKRHHYVTKSYLDGFLEPGQDQLYCWGRRKEGRFQACPDELAFIKNYYSFRGPDGEWNDTAEIAVANDVEAPGLKVLQKLAAGKTRLNWDERFDLSLLLAVQEFRVPHYREEIKNINKQLLDNVLLHYQKNKIGFGNNESIGLQTRHGVSNFKIEELKKEQARLARDTGEESLRMTLSLATDMSYLYRHMKWTLHSASGRESFTTSDCPVIKILNNETSGAISLNRDDLEIRFPLSKSAMIALTKDVTLVEQINHAKKEKEIRKILARTPEIRIRAMGDAQVLAANQLHASYARMWVFSGRPLDWPPAILREKSKNFRMWVEPEAAGFRLRSELQR